jgi:hypothetical protein
LLQFGDKALLLDDSGRENGFPIVFHADDDPTLGDRFVPGFVESADI